MKIAIIGGGPSGLYLGLLIKRHRPHWAVYVVEQNAADSTFGFGVVLADGGLAQLEDADAQSYNRLHAAMHYNDRQIIVQREEPIEVVLNIKGGAIPRLTLLKILIDEAEQAGVRIYHKKRIESTDALAEMGLEDADVVVGADGTNSILRREFATDFGTSQYTLTNHFAWYGTRKVFDAPALVFRKYRGGHFVGHYYAYSDEMSTFVAECDDATWARMGLDALTDDQRQTLIEKIFAPELCEHKLISNKSVWRQFSVIRNERWIHGRNVLIGDALASAHFSIGSGTRIAMSDAIALSGALLACDGDVNAGLNAFVGSHRGRKAKLISASERSYTWYEQIANWMDDYTPAEFVYHFMTRTGRINDARLRAEFPKLMRHLESHLSLP